MPDRLDFTLTAPDGVKLCCYEWPVDNARAAVIIVHGMAEHAARYGRFAGALNEAGFAAVSVDLRGHGKTAAGGTKGLFASKDGWRLVLEDIRRLSLWAKEKYPGALLVLFGHSMGSIFARAALFIYGEMYQAAVLSGVTTDLPVRRDVAPLVAGAVGLFQGMRRPSKLLDNLTFGSYNRPYKPARTRFEWLSGIREEVDKYVSDGDCGFVCTASLFYDLSLVLIQTLKRQNILRMPKGLPMLIVSGYDDHAGLSGKTAKELERNYRAAGIGVSAKVYPGGRHELLNDVTREQVTADIIGFISDSII